MLAHEPVCEAVVTNVWSAAEFVGMVVPLSFWQVMTFEPEVVQSPESSEAEAVPEESRRIPVNADAFAFNPPFAAGRSPLTWLTRLICVAAAISSGAEIKSVKRILTDFILTYFSGAGGSIARPRA